ncbi:MAG: hypothetical protein ACP5UR_16490 [Chloroflexus sp.]|uniref:hypothetical protein n=1 Tax=Chloroflexus sp. TaxID=1904827 RepID=UPI003D099E78
MNDIRHRALVCSILLGVAFSKLANVPIANATTPNRQSWVPQSGTCPSALEGTVFGLVNEGCNGTGTSFNTTYDHTRNRDAIFSTIPCESDHTTALRYCMWYSGVDAFGVRRITLALFPDSVTWTNVIGHSLSIIRDAASLFTPCEADRAAGLGDGMWYQIIDRSSRFFIGYTVSAGGLHSTHVPGPGINGSVIGQGPTGIFDGQTASSIIFTTDADTLALFSFNEGGGQSTTDRFGTYRTLTLGIIPNADTEDPL